MIRCSCALLVTLALSAPVFAQDTVPRFERGDCTFKPGLWASTVRLECGHLVVPQVRERPSAGTFRLAVAILHPLTSPTGPPLVMLHGGPSGPGGLRAGEMVGASRWAPILNRDVIVYDQRGAGLSEPPLCPHDSETSGRTRNIASRSERERAWVAGAISCVADLKAHGIEPSAFNTATNAADLIDLRTVLGYERWDLFGISYGAKLAQEAMRRDPSGVRSVVLHSPTVPGPAQEAESPLAFQRVLDRVFAACERQAECASAFPSLEKEFYALYDDLQAHPIEFTIGDGSGAIPVRFDGDRWLRALHSSFSRRASQLPLLVSELRRGDRLATARALAGNSGDPGSNVLTNLVGCFDGYGDDYHAAIDAVRKEVRPPFRPLVNDEEECPIWQDRFAPAADRAFVRSETPTLIITTEFDDRTPTSNGRRIAASLPNAIVVEMPGQTHGQGPRGCPEQIILGFLADPSSKPDTSCVGGMPALAFNTKRVDQPNVTVSIAGTDAPSVWLGRWEGVFPNAPVPYRFNLEAHGTALNGAIETPTQRFPIYDGAITDKAIRFRMKTDREERTITFAGTISDDAIAFTREVEVRAGAAPGGAAMFGAGGARTFTARRVQ